MFFGKRKKDRRETDTREATGGASPEPFEPEEGYARVREVPPHEALCVDTLSAYIGPAMQHQLALADEIGDHTWHVDFERGVIRLGERDYPIQFLGSESLTSGTWLWGTENLSGFSPALLEDVTAFCNGDLIRSLEEMRPAKIETDALLNGVSIAALAAASHREKVCYYRCPYDGGAAYVLVKDLPASVFAKATAERVVSVISRLIAEMPLNHRLLVTRLIERNCTLFDEKDASVIGYFTDGNELTVRFDERGRIASMNISAR